MKTPGQIAYEKWATQNGSLITIADAEWIWSNFTKRDKDIWEEIAKAVIAAQPCQHPFESVDWWLDSVKSWERVYKCGKCGKIL
jgi:hypothetical protein